MPQIGKIERTGDSLYLRLPTHYVDQLGLAEGDEVVISLVHDRLEIGYAAHRRLLAIERGRERSARYRGVVTAR